MELKKALFCNLDNTLITTRSERKIPLHSKDWKLDDSVLSCIKAYNKNSYLICIISNQLSIGEGYMSKEVFHRKMEEICTTIERMLKLEENIVYAYSTLPDIYNSKPNPGMAYDLAVEHELDLRNSIMVGNSEEDRLFSLNAGFRKYYNINEVEAISWNNLK